MIGSKVAFYSLTQASNTPLFLEAPLAAIQALHLSQVQHRTQAPRIALQARHRTSCRVTLA